MTHLGTIELAWPVNALSPNARPHWSDLAKAKKFARMDAWLLCRAAKIPAQRADASLHLRFTFHPKVKRARDLDNLLASMKAAIDGIRDALGVDDSRFSFAMCMGPVVRGGKVVVDIIAMKRADETRRVPPPDHPVLGYPG
ncbi:hypothetical protein [Ketogulonicigenium vulgare]|nr:hypothetical protein [Ketogulonicigenium vulgare]ALJ81559.1 hypothetical protein KVH_10460 [Ketogulonicigenium vulgare]ANW34254.1 hypothetical protein KvSKV_10400 [Ketogulonicigenium vulgare]AOZ55167.1 Phage-related protein [Ketogulonicigenium vulgare]